MAGGYDDSAILTRLTVVQVESPAPYLVGEDSVDTRAEVDVLLDFEMGGVGFEVRDHFLSISVSRVILRKRKV